MKKHVTLFICLTLCLAIFAQNAPKVHVVQVDPETGLVNGGFPFDRNFYIQIKIKKATDVIAVNLQKTYGPNFTLKTNKPTIYEDLKFRTEAIKGDDEYKHLMVLAPPLAPNGQYEIVLTRKYLDSDLAYVLDLFSLLYEGVGPEFGRILREEGSYTLKDGDHSKMSSKALAFYKKSKAYFDSTIVDFTAFERDMKSRYLELYERIAKGDGNNCSTLPVNSVERIICERDPKTLKLVKQYLKLISNVCGDNNKCEGLFPYNLGAYSDVFRDEFKTLYHDLKSFYVPNETDTPHLLDDDYQSKLASIFTDLQVLKKDKDLFTTSLKLLSNFKSFECADILELLNGEGLITGNLNQKRETNLTSKIKNINKNIDALNLFIEDLKDIRLLYPQLDAMFDDLISETKALIVLLKKFKGEMETIISKILKLDVHVIDEFIFTNTQFEKISKEAAHWVLPDVGVLYAFNKNYNVIRPFLGVNINFGPVDKDIKTRYITRDNDVVGANKLSRFLRQHTSLMLGVSFGTLKIENERDDLFNSINLITGFGVRLNRALRISGGALWYKQVNPNPLISDKKTKAMGYLSVSFDIEFRNATQGNLNKLF